MARCWVALDSLARDVGYGGRMLRRNPGFAAAAILTIALGIGANTAVFTVVDQTLFRYAPFAYADRLVDVIGVDRPGGGGGNNLTPATVIGWQSHGVFDRFEAYAPQTFEIAGDGEPEHVSGYAVTTGLFSMLGVAPARGRAFVQSDGQPGAARSVLISESLWRRRFGAAPDTLGRRLTLNGEPYTVVGIMPRRFRLGASETLWVPFDLRGHATDAAVTNFMGLGRLPPRVSIAGAQQRADEIARGLQQSTPLPRGWYVRLVPRLVARVTASVKTAMLVLLGAVGFVLLIACANLANLLLARATTREREMAVRSALGASRARLVAQALTESGLIAVAGGLVGVAFAAWGVQAVIKTAPATLSFMAAVVEIDARVLLVASALTVGTGLLSGLVPALRGSRPNLDRALRDSRAGGRWPLGRIPGLLVVTEVALSLVLLVGAALMTRTFVKLHAIDPGFDPHDVVSLNVSVPVDRYPPGPLRTAFTQAIVRGLSTLPVVTAVSIADGLPGHTSFSVGVPEADGSASISTHTVIARNEVDGAFFRALRVPVVAGRTFGDTDMDDAMIVNKALADYYWPDGSAIGRRFRPYAPAPWSTIVGVVGDVAARLDDRPLKWQMYFPVVSRPASPATPVAPPTGAPRRFFTRPLIVRAPNPGAVVADLKARVWAVDPMIAIERVQFAEDTYAAIFAPQRFVLLLMGVFSGIALMLAAAGLFAVLAQAVAQRTREIGIRVALGAEPADIFRLIVSRGLVLTAAGIVAGVAGALALSRVLSGLLYEVGPYDPVSFAAVIVLLIGVAIVACWWPTRRALRVEAALALRVE